MEPFDLSEISLQTPLDTLHVVVHSIDAEMEGLTRVGKDARGSASVVATRNNLVAGVR